jgi:hypothetical protein
MAPHSVSSLMPVFCLTGQPVGVQTAFLRPDAHPSDKGYGCFPDLKAVGMLAHRYKVWSWGKKRSDGQEDCVKVNAGITVVAKRHLYEKFEVFNELVAMTLGRALGLPIPVGFVIEKDNDPYYCSGNIAPGNEFPDADVEHLAINNPRVACGIAIFDAWICNHDRNLQNIFYDCDSGSTFLIDHGQALLGILGPKHIRQDEDRLQLYEAFAKELRDFSAFGYWYDRLVRIPEHMIMDTVRDAAGVGVDEGDAIVAGRLLVTRRSSLPALFKASKSLFPKLEKSLFCPFEADNDPVDYII